MLYHINFDGKIFPCRAKIKKCPYGDNRHSSNYDDLYYNFQDEYNYINPSPNLIAKMKTGVPFSGISEIDDEIAKSDSPVELICSTMKLGIKYAGCTNLSSADYDQREDAINTVVAMYQGGRAAPEFLPKSLVKEAYDRFGQEKKSPIYQPKYYRLTDGDYTNLKNQEEDLNRIENYRNTHFQMSPEDTANYKNAVRQDFNQWAELLNTRKLISQPMIVGNDTKVETDLSQINDADLLSIYDDTTVSDVSVASDLSNINYFRREPSQQLSDEANANVQKWLKESNQAIARYIIGSSRRTYLSIKVANELQRRGVNFGDRVYANLERRG